MKVILNQDVYNLGEEGDVCSVKRGYARNYLIPKQLAFPYTKQMVAIFDAKREQIEKRKLEKREAAKTLKDQLESIELVLKMPAGDTGKLFGAVTSLTVAEELARKGHTIERKKIELPEHNLKMVGNYSAKVKLYESEVAELKLVIEAAEDSKKSKSSASAKDNKKAAKAADDAGEVEETETVKEEPTAATEAPAEEAAPAEEEAAPVEAEAPAEEENDTVDSEATTLSSEEAEADESEEATIDSESDSTEAEADTVDSEKDE